MQRRIGRLSFLIIAAFLAFSTNLHAKGRSVKKNSPTPTPTQAPAPQVTEAQMISSSAAPLLFDPNLATKTFLSPAKYCEVRTYPRYSTFLGMGGNFTNDNMLSIVGIKSTIADVPSIPPKFSNKIVGSDFGQTHGLDFYSSMILAPGGNDPQTILLISGFSTQGYTKNNFKVDYSHGRAELQQEAREVSKIYITGKSVMTPDENNSILLRGGLELGIQNFGDNIPGFALSQQKFWHSLLPMAFAPINVNPENIPIKAFASILTGIGFQMPMGDHNSTRGDPFGYATAEAGLKVFTLDPIKNSFNYVLAEIAIPVSGSFRITGANLIRVHAGGLRGDFEAGVEGTLPPFIGSIPLAVHYRVPYGNLMRPLIGFDEDSAKIEFRIGVPIPNNLLKLD